MSCGEDGHANYNSSLFAVVIRLPELSGQSFALSSNTFVLDGKDYW